MPSLDQKLGFSYDQASKCTSVMSPLDASEFVAKAPPAAMRPETPAIVCVLPAYNEAENLQRIVPALCARLPLLSPDFGLIVVDDGSSDATASVAVALSARYPVTLVRLSRNFGKEAAISAGIDHADGDIVIVMDSDGQHPIDMLVLGPTREAIRNGARKPG